MPKSAFGFKRSEDSPGFLLWQTTITWQRLIKKVLDAYDISHAQFVILAVTLWLQEKAQEPTQTAIIDLSKLDKMTVSKALQKLVRENLVKRAEHKKDTRAKVVFLTAKGRALARKLIPIVEGVDENFFGTLQKNNQKSLIYILSKLISNLKKERYT